MKTNLIYIIIVAIIVVGCNNSKKIVSPPAIIPTAGAAVPAPSKTISMDHLLAMNKVDFTTFSARVEVESQTEAGKNPDAVAKLLMKKNEFIWVSLQSSFL